MKQNRKPTERKEAEIKFAQALMSLSQPDIPNAEKLQGSIQKEAISENLFENLTSIDMIKYAKEEMTTQLQDAEGSLSVLDAFEKALVLTKGKRPQDAAYIDGVINNEYIKQKDRLKQKVEVLTDCQSKIGTYLETLNEFEEGSKLLEDIDNGKIEPTREVLDKIRAANNRMKENIGMVDDIKKMLKEYLSGE